MVFMIIFAPAQKYWCNLNNSKVSKLKVEKVLSPPQIPVRIKSLIADGYSILSFTSHNVIPKIRQLLIFAERVATGNVKAVL